MFCGPSEQQKQDPQDSLISGSSSALKQSLRKKSRQALSEQHNIRMKAETRKKICWKKQDCKLWPT
uniref:Uncharacterized protein n=1 Tax=Arundo donax TaxID=35708 RepID=A0A0A9GH04_ARUDO